MKDIEGYFDKPYYIVDILSRQVPKDSPGQYFAVEEYYLRDTQYGALREKYFNILLRMSCFFDICVSSDCGESWKDNPSPDELRHIFTQKDPVLPVYVLAEAKDVLLTLMPDDTYMTVYNPDPAFLALLAGFVSSEGLFIWQPEEGKEKKKDSKELLERAKALAKEKFSGVPDKAGVDYFEVHLTSVASLVSTEEEKTVAYLHDIIEDRDYPEEDLRAEFGDRIADAVRLLTHEGGLDEEGYLECIRKIKKSGNELAIAVKTADLTNNSDYTRLGASSPDELGDTDRKRYEKYQKALKILKE